MSNHDPYSDLGFCISWEALALPFASGDLLSTSIPVDRWFRPATTLYLLLARCAGVTRPEGEREPVPIDAFTVFLNLP